MNILLVSHEYPPDTNYGGIATYMHALAVEMAAQGHFVHVLTRSTVSRTEHIVDEGVIVHRIAYPSQWNGLQPHLFNDLYAKLVSEQIDVLHQLFHIDVIQTADYGSELIHYNGDIPVVVLLVTSSELATKINRLDDVYPLTKGERYVTSMVNQQEKFQTEMADAIIASSEYVKNVTIKDWGIPAEKIRNIPLSISEPGIIEQGHPFLVGPLYKRVLFYGRLEPRKGPHTLLSAFDFIAEQNPDVEFVLFGKDTPYGPQGGSFLKYLLHNEHASVDYKKIRFVNQWLPDDQKKKHIDLSDVVVVPSIHESFGLVPLEVLARRKKVVISDKMGITEHIKNLPNVFVFRAEDPRHLAEQINRALTTDGNPIDSTQNLLVEVSKSLHISKVAEQTTLVYQTVVQDKESTIEPIAYTPLISIMVIAYNAVDYTKALVKSIKCNTYYPYIINILDNGSTDGTRDWLQSIQNDPDIHVVLSDTNVGCAGGRNILIEQGCAGDFILFIDNDCILGKDWDLDVLRYFQADPFIGVVGQTAHNITVSRSDRQATPVLQAGQADIVTGYFMLMRCSLVNLVGDFDNEVVSFWHEDDDYCVRAAACGFRNLKVPVKVHHFEHKSSQAAGIEHTEISDPSVLRRRHLVSKWHRMGFVKYGQVVYKENIGEIVDAIIAGQFSQPLEKLDIYTVRSTLDMLLELPFDWTGDILADFADYLIKYEQYDFLSYLLERLLTPIRISKIEANQHAAFLVLMAQLTQEANESRQILEEALTIDPDCQQASELLRSLSAS